MDHDYVQLMFLRLCWNIRIKAIWGSFSVTLEAMLCKYFPSFFLSHFKLSGIRLRKKKNKSLNI